MFLSLTLLLLLTPQRLILLRQVRWKRTVVCKGCAVAKNVCQCCLFDLQYALPVAVCHPRNPDPKPLP